jgi:putative exosortase-associated protein (TIGR04073 family)
MKKLLIILAILLIISSVAYADKGSGRAVSREVVEVQEPVVQVIQREAPQPVVQQVVMPRQVQQEPQVVAPQAIQIKDDTDLDALYHDAGCQCVLCRWSNSDNYGVKFGGQFLRGLFNAGTCWVEIPVTTYERTIEGDTPIVDTVVGCSEGIVRTVLRAGSGVIDVGTSWIPWYKNQLIFKSQPTLICEKI